MTTKKLDLSYWLSGAIDYVPERNLVGVRTFDNSERMNVIDRQRPELVSLFPNPLLELSGGKAETPTLLPSKASEKFAGNNWSPFSFTNYPQQQLKLQLELQQRIKGLASKTPQQLLALQTTTLLETAVGTPTNATESATLTAELTETSKSAEFKPSLATKLKAQAQGLLDTIKQKLSSRLNSGASLRQAEVKKNFWLNSDLAPQQVEDLNKTSEQGNAVLANVVAPAEQGQDEQEQIAWETEQFVVIDLLATHTSPASSQPITVYPKLLDLSQYKQLDSAHIAQIQQFQQHLPLSLQESLQQVKYITPQQSGVISLITATPELSLSSLATQLRQGNRQNQAREQLAVSEKASKAFTQDCSTNLEKDLANISEQLKQAEFCQDLEIIDLQLVSGTDIIALSSTAKTKEQEQKQEQTEVSAASEAEEESISLEIVTETPLVAAQSEVSRLQQVIGNQKPLSAHLLNDLYVSVPSELVFYTSQWLKSCGFNLTYSLNSFTYSALLDTKARLQQQNISLGNRQQWLQQQLVQQAASYGLKYRLSQRLNYILRSYPYLVSKLLESSQSISNASAVENFDFMQLSFNNTAPQQDLTSLEQVQFFNHSPQLVQALSNSYSLPYATLLMNTEVSGVSEIKLSKNEQQAWDQANKLLENLDLEQSLSQTVAHFSQVDSNLWMQEVDLSKRAKLCLEQCFGLKQYRPLQQEIIESLLAGKDTLAILATGSGKSLCYQIPGLCLDGCTIVVSPLISLMKDQISQLATYGISAASINNTTSVEEKTEIMQQIMQRKIKFLYVAPERVINDYFLRELASLPICLIAIDEAHCVSQWGHDFRPHYQKLFRIRNLFNYHIPIIAATATARVNTRSDIIESLQMQNPNIYIGDFNRDNLYLKVQKVKNKGHRDKTLQRLLTNTNRLPAIVYCYARKTVENVCEMLRKEGFRASRYHAELTHAEREQNQHDFISGKIDIMVATIAFGMGINKSDVRQVIHYDYPSTLENYYQEIGRAGRDGEPAIVTLLDDEGNREWREKMYLDELQNTVVELDPQTQQIQQFNQEFLSHQNNLEHRDYIRNISTDSPQIERNPEFSPAMKLKKLQEVFDFCDSQNCRRRVLLSAFNQILEHDCGNCDICANGRHKIVIKDDLRVVLGLISVFQSKVSFITLVRILAGKANPATELEVCYNLAGSKIVPEQLEGLSKRIENLCNSTFTAGSEYWSALIEQLLELRCIEYDKKYSYLGITEFGYELYKQNKSIELASNSKLEKRNVYLDQLQLDLHALAIKVGEYLEVRYDAVISDPIIRGILEKLPTNIEELKQIDGFTDRRIKLIGKYVLNQVKVHKQRLSLRDPKYTPN